MKTGLVTRLVLPNREKMVQLETIPFCGLIFADFFFRLIQGTFINDVTQMGEVGESFCDK